MSKVHWYFLFILLLTSPLPARELTLESMNESVWIRDPQFSPQGNQILLLSNRSGESKIWLLEPDTKRARILLQDEEAETSPIWSVDGWKIAFLRRSGSGTDLWLVGTDGSGLRRISSDAGSMRSLAWSSTADLIAFISDRNGYQDLFTIDTENGKIEQLTEKTNPWDEFRWEPGWSPDGRQIAYVSNKSDALSDDLWVVDVATHATRKLTSGLHVMSTPIWSPDGRSIAFNAVKTEEFWYGDMSDIYIVEMPSRTLRKIEMNTFVSDGNGNVKMTWSPDGRSIFFRYQWQGDDNLWSVPAGGGVATQITYESGTFRELTVSPDGRLLAYVRSTPLSSGEVYFQSTAGGQARQVTNWVDPFDQLKAPTRIAFQSGDGKYIMGYLYYPPDFKDSQKYPGLVQVHGGGNNAYGNGFHALEHWLSRQGFVVLAIEYRGSAGHGRQFQDLALGEWAAGQGWDAVAAARYLRSLSSNNGKVGIYGGSYGGIMSMAAVTRDSEPFNAVAPLYGIFDWEDAYAHGDRLMQFWIIEGHFGFRPGENPDLYEHTASIRHLDKIKPDLPFLILHGERDRRAPFQQSVRLAAALKERGNPVEFHSYPNEGHGFGRPENRVDAYGRLLHFFNQYLK